MATSFTSYWGNALLGIYIEWGNTAASNGTIDGTTALTCTFNLNLYAAGAVSQTGSTYFADTNLMQFYLLILNPLDQFDALADSSGETISNTMLGFDGVLVELEAKTSGDGNTDSTPMTLALKAYDQSSTIDYNNILKDINCENTLSLGQYDDTKCWLDTDTGSGKVTGGSDADWELVTKDNAVDYCIENWTIAVATDATTTTWTERCTKVQVPVTRLFETGDNATSPASNGEDVYDLDL